MFAERRLIIVLFAVALGVRVLYVAAVAPHLDIERVTSELRFASKIASGTDWIKTPLSPRAPGYPILLAVFQLASVKQTWLMHWYQAVLGALNVVMLYVLARAMLDVRASVLAALWLAVSIPQLYFSSLFERDVFTTLVLLTLLVVLTHPLRGVGFGAFAGVTYALLIHVDPQFIWMFPIFAAIVLFLKRGNRFLRVQYTLVFAATAVVASIPSTVRNELVYHQTVPVALEASKYVRPARGLVRTPERSLADLEKTISRMAGANRWSRNTVEFWRFARWRDTPAPRRTGEIIERAPGTPAWSLRRNIATVLSFGVLLPFFLFGIFRAFRERELTALALVLTVLGFFVIHVYIGASDRARLPVEPLVIVLAFYGVFGLVRRSRPVISTGGEKPR